MSAYQFASTFDRSVKNIGDDFADRMSYRYTVVLLVTCSMITMSKMYIADPISCWVPKHFSGDHGHEQYTNDYCWIASTYYAPFEKEVPLHHEVDKRHVVRYYQWVPIMLGVQALLFYIPIVLWGEMSHRSGINVEKMVKLGKALGSADTPDDETADNRKHIVNVIDKVISSRQSLKGRFFPSPCSREKGNFLFSRYLLVKLLFIANVIWQFCLLSTFLDCNFPTFGIELLQSMVRGDAWEGFRRFPRVTMCDLQVRRLANIHQYTVQCVLIINLFTEKIYLLLWFWFIGVFIISVASALKWAMFLLKGPRVQYLKMLMDVKDSNSKHTLTDFTTEYLCHDGFFTVKLIEENVGPVVASDLLLALYEKFIGPSASTSGRGSQSDDTAPIIGKKRTNPEDISNDSSLPPYATMPYGLPESYSSLAKPAAGESKKTSGDKMTVDADVLPPPRLASQPSAPPPSPPPASRQPSAPLPPDDMLITMRTEQ